MKKNLIQKIVIGVLAASTISVSVAMAVILNNTYVTVTLRAGEGSFENNQQNIVLQNVRPGSSLKTIRGYVLPSKNNDDYTFDNWLDENEDYKIVEQDAQINRNTVLVASYTYSTKYYREKYYTQINKEIQDVLDYSIYDQFHDLNYTIADAMDDIKPMIEVLNNQKITSIESLTQIYQLLHECVQTINQIPCFHDYHTHDKLSSYYHQLTQICIEEIDEIQKAQSDNQAEALGLLARNHLATYRSANRELINKACEKYRNDVMNATNDIDIEVAKQIGGGFIRSSYVLDTEQKYDNVLSTIENKIKEAKQTITDHERLITFIDFLGDCTANYCKITTLGNPKEISTAFEEMYTLAFKSFTELDAFNQQKYQAISSLIKGNAYNLDPGYIGVILNEKNLLSKIDEDIEGEQLPIEKVTSITSIVCSAAKALDINNEYAVEPYSFIGEIVSGCIDKYIETPNFLEFILYAMDVAKNIIPNDVYVKEGGAGFSGELHINLYKLKYPIESAYTFYTNNISKVDADEDAIYEDALKILVKGIIQSSVYGTNDYGGSFIGLDNSVNMLNQLLGLIQKKSYSKSVALRNACVLTGVPTLYTHIGNVLKGKGTERDEIFTLLNDLFKYKWGKYFDFIKNEQDEARAIKVGSMAGLHLGLDIPRFIHPYIIKDPSDVNKIFNNALADLEKWANQISKISPAAHTAESFEALGGAIYETINSSRIRHFAGLDDWDTYMKYYLLIIERTESVINVIYESTYPEQMINRANIYIDEFLTVLNKWSYGEEAIDLDELQEKVIADMRKV